MSCLTTEVQDAARAAAGTILDQFAADLKRQDRMSLSVGSIYLDVAKQSWDRATFEALIQMAEQSPLSQARARMWSGGAINQSENRAVLHVALRATDAENALARGQALADEVAEGRAAMKAFAEGVRRGDIRGSTGKPFGAIVHIGIGGSDLGPRVLWDALRPAQPDFDLRFVANVDGAELSLALAGLDPETTLVIGVSKTFGTQETLANLIKARDWLAAHLGEDKAGQHLAAVSAAPEKAAAYGIAADRVFSFRDWVGGRYSLWSAVSLSVAVALGYEVFQRLLDGAREMDQHFLLAPMDQSAPVLLALAQYHNRVLRD
ncbi:MAG: glucose-6-phosphate isomerase, partial [Asticcacaulis sp.]